MTNITNPDVHAVTFAQFAAHLPFIGETEKTVEVERLCRFGIDIVTADFTALTGKENERLTSTRQVHLFPVGHDSLHGAGGYILPNAGGNYGMSIIIRDYLSEQNGKASFIHTLIHEGIEVLKGGTYVRNAEGEIEFRAINAGETNHGGNGWIDEALVELRSIYLLRKNMKELSNRFGISASEIDQSVVFRGYMLNTIFIDGIISESTFSLGLNQNVLFDQIMTGMYSESGVDWSFLDKVYGAGSAKIMASINRAINDDGSFNLKVQDRKIFRRNPDTSKFMRNIRDYFAPKTKSGKRQKLAKQITTFVGTHVL